MQVHLGTIVVIFALAAAAPLIVDVIPRIVLPVVVVEILLGIVFGQPGLGMISVTPLAQLLSAFGLAFLFFLAGFDLDLEEVRGTPAKLALRTWLVSVAAGFGVAAALQAVNVIVDYRFVAVALTTTALGTLAPILRDNGDGEGTFGAMVSAAGAFGEIGPIILISLLLTETSNRGLSALLLVGFAILAGCAAYAAPRFKPTRVIMVIEKTMEATGQLAVRMALLLLIFLVYLTSELHLDVVLGAFAAGLLASIACGEEAHTRLQPRMDAVGYGVFVPIFFVVTGMKFDLQAITGSTGGLLKLPLFVVLLLVVRGLPTLLMYRAYMRWRDRRSLALYSSTGLPLIVAVTTLGIEDGHMRASTAAALVGAGMISVLVFPQAAHAVRERAPTMPAP
jgi:Kef-type K+ transport system membrane component KefB